MNNSRSTVTKIFLKIDNNRKLANNVGLALNFADHLSEIGECVAS